jgi:hypothetical protein
LGALDLSFDPEHNNIAKVAELVDALDLGSSNESSTKFESISRYTLAKVAELVDALDLGSSGVNP